MLTNPTVKKSSINRLKASRLFKKYEEMNLLGSGLLQFEKGKRLDLVSDLSCVVCNLQDLSIEFISEVMSSSRGIALKIEEKYLNSSKIFKEFMNHEVLKMMNDSQIYKQNIKAVMIQWKSHLEHSIIAEILIFLQQKQFSIIVKPQLGTANWQEYQQTLASFSFQVLESEYLALSSLSIVVELPEINSQHYWQEVLGIWRRTLPTEIGRLIIKDKMGKQNDLISELFYQKNMRNCWQIQFITSDIARVDRLSQQIIGLF